MAGRGTVIEKPGEREAAWRGVTMEQKAIQDAVNAKSVSAGSYEMLRCDLVCPRPDGGASSFPLSDMFVELSIFEDLYSNVLRGSITLRDSGGNLESLPIIGEESLRIIAHTTGTDSLSPSTSGKSQVIDNKFRVVSISNITEEKDRVKVYTLDFISPEYVLNLSKKVQRSFPNNGEQGMPISDMIEEIYNQYLMKDTGAVDKFFKVEETQGLQKIAISNMTPFGAINFLSSRALSKINPDGSLFFFYETLTDGFRFESAETLMHDQEPRANYVYTPQNIGESPGTSLYVAENPEQVSTFDVLSNMTTGMYNSRLITHDIVRMKYSVLNFNYIPQTKSFLSVEYDDDAMEDIPITETNPDAGVGDPLWPKHQTHSFINDKFKHLEMESELGNRISTDELDAAKTPQKKFNPSVVKMFPTNNKHDIIFNQSAGGITREGGFGEPNIKSNQVEKWMLQRPAQLQMLSNIRIRFTVAGDTTRHVGDVINFDMPSHVTGDGDQFYRGKYLVTQVRHRFGEGVFKTEMELAKDSFNTRLDMQAKKPHVGANVEGSSAIVDGKVKMIDGRVIGGF